MKKIKNIISLACLLLLAAGCNNDSDDNTIIPDTPGGHNKPGWVMQSGKPVSEAPLWQPKEDELLTSSMTVTLTLDATFPDSGIDEEDMVAAFGAEDDCLGCSKVSFGSGSPRFYVYVLPPADPSGSISFAYYSKKANRVYCWSNRLTFENNRSVGSVRDPYILKGDEENYGCMDNAVVYISLSAIPNIDWNNDEFAMFVGNECRMVLTSNDYRAEENILAFYVPVNNFNEKISLHYYSHAEDRILTSPDYDIQPYGICNIEQLTWK